jgi:hypothetical protein
MKRILTAILLSGLHFFRSLHFILLEKVRRTRPVVKKPKSTLKW